MTIILREMRIVAKGGEHEEETERTIHLLLVHTTLSFLNQMWSRTDIVRIERPITRVIFVRKRVIRLM
jgi:hypothetical protein